METAQWVRRMKQVAALLLALCCGFTGGSASSAHAQVFADESDWVQKLADMIQHYETNDSARNHVEVLEAFRPTVSQSSPCTVRVLCHEQQVALGTIFDASGYIATKGSEVQGDVTCQLANGQRYEARLVGVDRGSDLAVLKITAHDLPAITWSDSDAPAVGSWVVTPGQGRLPLAIGIVSVAAHPVRGGVLGIQMAADQQGARITRVVPGSGAALAGLGTGDVITHVNDQQLTDVDHLVTTTSHMLPGESLQLRVFRDQQTRVISATLGSVADTLTSRRAQFQDQLGTDVSQRRFLFPSALEHDSVLQPCQCGSALVGLDGKAIGLNIARASRISCYSIPSHVARPILTALRDQDLAGAKDPVAAQTPQASLAH